MDLGLKGKVALVTGASKGLGHAIADEFAKEGAHLSICARGKEDLDKAAEGLRQHGVKVVATQADVASAGDVQCVIDGTIKQLGRIDVLINNAGDGWLSHALNTTDEEWLYCLEVNLMSAVTSRKMGARASSSTADTTASVSRLIMKPQAFHDSSCSVIVPTPPGRYAVRFGWS